MKRIIQTKKAPKAVGPYSQAIRAGDFVFISGQIPLDPATGEVIEGNIREQTERVLENIRGILDDSGATLRDVVKTTVYLTNMSDFLAVNEVYSRFFGIDSPARTTVEVSRLPKGVLVEIDAIAWVGNP